MSISTSSAWCPSSSAHPTSQPRRSRSAPVHVSLRFSSRASLSRTTSFQVTSEWSPNKRVTESELPRYFSLVDAHLKSTFSYSLSSVSGKGRNKRSTKTMAVNSVKSLHCLGQEPLPRRYHAKEKRTNQITTSIAKSVAQQCHPTPSPDWKKIKLSTGPGWPPTRIIPRIDQSTKI